MSPRLRRPRRRSVLAVLGVLVLVLGAAGAWVTAPQPLLPEATAALASTAEVAFTEVDGRLEFAPASGAPAAGLIVYPGGKVPPAAYAPLARTIAAAGYLVVVVPVPLNLAVLDIAAADPVVAAHPELAGRWVGAGHSLGGAMVAQYAADHPGTLAGLALWAAYSPADLSGSGLAVVSAWGTLDAGRERMGGPEARAALPADAAYVEIGGGNHGQMGWYTGQPNDPPATISREAQQAAVATATIHLLERVAAGS